LATHLEAIVEPRLLASTAEKIEAFTLLFSCYVNDQKWSPEANNPSSFRVDRMNGLNVLVDKFDSRSKWVGVYHEDEIVACCRILTPDPSGLEFNLYSKTHIPDLQNYVELNRFAVRAGFENTVAIPLLIKFSFSTCLTLKALKIITTMSYPYPAQFASKVGFKEIEGSNFKYSARDNRDVSIFTFDLTNQQEVAKFFNIFDSLLAA
jgi:hypothetical protein